jgi:UDP-N-acetylmuramate--alanine ligase
MNINQIRSIYFLGIGGIGMSALARYFHSRGVRVYGYDKTPSSLTNSLQQEGIVVQFDEDISKLPDNIEFVVYTPAIPVNNLIFTHLANSTIPIKKRAEVLGIIGSEMPTIAVAGTHGKTTICSMLAHIFMTANMPFIGLLGGIATNYNTNYLQIPGARWLLVEADEYDRSFLHLNPDIAVITSIDADHLDIYETENKLRNSFAEFAGKIKTKGVLLVKEGVDIPEVHHARQYTYNLNKKCDFYASEYHLRDGRYSVSIAGCLHLKDVVLGLPGQHNVENAIAAAALANFAGVDVEDIQRGLNSFIGVKRRFEICFSHPDTTYIDDYAHHPEELNACIKAAKEMYPGKTITGIFQPHLFSRTRDLASGFAKSLSLLNELILLDIYPAREEPIPGIDAAWLLEKVPLKNKTLVSKEQLVELLKQKDIEILITMGAGDIDTLVAPIREMLEKRLR